jgi:uncharacterized protein YegL
MVLDKSGSMDDMKRPVINGYNEYLQSLAKEPAEIRLMQTQFSDGVEVVHGPVPLARAPKLTDNNYLTEGSTALYDGIGETIKMLEGEMRPEDRVIVLIMTDGDENYSRIWQLPRLHAKIKEKQLKGWTFIFFGANTIDAKAAGAELGIEAGNVLSFEATGAGVEKIFENVTERTVLLLTDGSQ